MPTEMTRACEPPGAFWTWKQSLRKGISTAGDVENRLTWDFPVELDSAMTLFIIHSFKADKS